MCFFKKKKQKKVLIENSKYQLGQWVYFKYRGEVCPGVIYDMHLDNDDKVIYDVQIGGECPIIIESVNEEKIFTKDRR